MEITTNELPPTRKYNWLLIYGFLGLVVVSAAALILMYRQMPKRTSIVTKRKNPATKSVVVTALSPMDSLSTKAIQQEIFAEIGADSADTKMVVGGTHIYKQCTSFADYRDVMNDVILNAHAPSLKKQGLIMSQIAGIVLTDTLPTKLYLIGEFGTEGFDPIRKRLGNTAYTLELRSHVGKVQIISYRLATSARQDSIQTLFLREFSEHGLEVIERPIPKLISAR